MWVGGKRLVQAGAGAVALQVAASGIVHAQTTPRDLSSLSIEELGDIQVTSVSKRAETVMDAPAAVYRISREDALRSGADSLPEILRLAPNLQVAQSGAAGYAISARGMNGNPEAQNFPNKLLVLIDGRSVYSPLYSGVYWDMQDVLPADLDRIEVVGGPGGTLWGANAVNGVINITTRSADETQGLYVQGRAGAEERGASVRYGGRLGTVGAFRVYARGVRLDASRTSAGVSAGDAFRRGQGGFRADWNLGDGNSLTVSGDLYDGRGDRAATPAEDLSGRNLTARWRRVTDGSTLQLQAYYDHNHRAASGSGAFGLDTYDFDLQHALAIGRHQLVWGGGARVSRHDIQGNDSLLFRPASRTLRLYNLFAQDSIALGKRANLTLGLKVEDGSYAGAQWLPSLRLNWRAAEGVSLWGAISRGVRAVTPFDHDVVERLGGADFLVGGIDIRPEKLTAYEVGARFKPGDRALISISAYHNAYDDLRSIEVTPVSFLPLRWGNGMTGYVRGLEVWGEFKAQPWWRLSAGATALEKHLKFKPGASGILGVAQAGDDPSRQAFVRSSMDLVDGISLDADLRYVSDLPSPYTPSYIELGGRLAWAVNDRAEIALVGRNLLQDRHPEYPQGTQIPRALSVDLQWRF